MKFGKLSAVAAAAVIAVAGNVVAGGGYTAEPTAASSDYMFWADAKTGYEGFSKGHGRGHAHNSFWAVRTKVGVEATAGSMQGLGFEARLGGMFNTSKHSPFNNIAEAGASLGWNFGSMIAEDMTFRPMVGYERRYFDWNGVLVGLDLGTKFADDHYIGVRGGLDFLVGHKAKQARRIAYDVSAMYNYSFSSNAGLGLELGYRNIKTHKRHKHSMHHYQVLAGFNFSA